LTRKLILASAGAGKSKHIVSQAIKKAALGQHVLILTYTENNQKELLHKFCNTSGFLHPNVTIKGWFTFLLQDMIRPYQSCIFSDRISGVNFNSANPHIKNSRSIPGRAEKVGSDYNHLHFLTSSGQRAHTSFLSKLAIRINSISNQKPILRIDNIYQSIFIDEVQDLVGWDFEVLRLISKSAQESFYCVGDMRQTLYSTHTGRKSPITNVEKLGCFQKIGLKQEQLNVSWRCIQDICDYADSVHRSENIYTATESKVKDIPKTHADHLGIYIVKPKNAQAYLKKYNPTILRINRNTRMDLCQNYESYNFGESKGMSFNRILICVTEKQKSFLKGNLSAFDDDQTEKAKNTFYVAITRARFSVAFLCPDEFDTIETWKDS